MKYEVVDNLQIPRRIMATHLPAPLIDFNQLNEKSVKVLLSTMVEVNVHTVNGIVVLKNLSLFLYVEWTLIISQAVYFTIS